MKFNPAPARLMAQYFADPPIELARGINNIELADLRALTGNMGHGWNVWREIPTRKAEKLSSIKCNEPAELPPESDEPLRAPFNPDGPLTETA